MASIDVLSVCPETRYREPFQLPFRYDPYDPNQSWKVLSTPKQPSPTPPQPPLDYDTVDVETPCVAPLYLPNGAQPTPPPRSLPMGLSPGSFVLDPDAPRWEPKSMPAYHRPTPFTPCWEQTRQPVIDVPTPPQSNHHQKDQGPLLKDVACDVEVDDPRLTTPAWRAFVLQVAFKFAVLPYYYHSALAADTMVFVAGDRGYDLGKVVSSSPVDKAPEIPKESSHRLPPVVFRPASPKELRTTSQERAEAEVVRKAQQILDELQRDNHELQSISMSFSDAEFQYDGRKLTLYYKAADLYVNYRPLLKPLYDVFQCRIWLQRAAEQSDSRASEERTSLDRKM